MFPRPCRLCILAALLLLLPAALGAQVNGCTDPLAVNYNGSATHNDGSCTYPQTTLTASVVAQLADTIRETSGLLYWDGTFWTHNDDADTTLYAIDTADGHIVKRFRIAGAPAHDWEDITQDEDYFYIGDFGNNAAGNRQDLVILRIPKTALLLGQNTTIVPDKIFFSYADQTVFTPAGNNNTNFDCEAFIAAGDSLYLFTKGWISGTTKLYAIPKKPGTYAAGPQGVYNVDGLVTGATYLPAKKVIALSGYKIAGITFQPFICLLYDYTGNAAFSGNKRKILVNPLYHQAEGIASIDGSRFFITNEKLTQSAITITPKLQKLDLSAYLSNWYGSLGLHGASRIPDMLSFYPSPAHDHFSTHISAGGAGRLEARLYNEAGQVVARRIYQLNPGINKISFEPEAGHPPGIYFLQLSWNGKTARGRICLY